MFDDEIHEDDLYEDYLVSVAAGSVLRRDGRPLHLTDVIKRRWGWPKKAARLAGQHFTREGLEVFLHDAQRRQQQQQLLKDHPAILVALLDGSARGATREALDVGRLLDRLELRFSSDIYEQGLVSSVIRTLAGHFGLTFQEMRTRINFQTGPLGERILHINTDGLDE